MATVTERKQAANSALKFWKPTSPGQRFRATIRRDGIWQGKPKASLVTGVKNHAGRDNSGRISVRHRGGGHKKKLRLVDFKRTMSTAGVVERLEYDPNRTGYIALVRYSQAERKDPEYRYILAPQDLHPGDTVASGADAPIKPGSTLALADIPVGMPIYNIEMQAGAGAKLCRAAGCVASIVNKQDRHAIVRLPSGELRLFPMVCRATIGSVSNPQNRNRVIAKAGYNRWRGIRPSVRGIAMNPVDHPHGGRTNGGRPSCSPWGAPCKGFRTRRRSKSTKHIVMDRRKAKGKV
eukprot:jgi/Chrzof1/7856/Cz02g39010.t1